MKRKTAIKASSLPTKSPVGGTILLWLLLDRVAAPEWAFGVLWTVAALGMVSFIYCFFTTVERDVPGFGEK